jgi:dTDP-4-dehydrorhamnose reductase
MARILLLGKIGQLGWEAERTLAPLGEVTALDYPDVDFTNPESLRGLVAEIKPQVIYNAAAYTAVDKAESEPEKARLINAVAPGVLAEAARAARAVMVHVSTDYVFDGTKGSPYFEEDATHPLGVYGQTKLDGELAVSQVGGAYVTLRTSMVFSNRRDSFVAKVLQWSRQQATLKIVADQVGNPTWARMLAEITTLLLARSGNSPAGWMQERRGLYHLAGSGHASRMEWGQAILRNDPKQAEQVVEQVLPAVTADFPTPAQRPLFSALDCSRFSQVFDLQLPHWEHTLRLAMETQA